MSTQIPNDLSGVIEAVVGDEGDKYTYKPNDRGGPTKYGVTQATARAYGYTGDMKDLPRELAVRIYSDRFINTPQFDKVFAISKPVGYALVDYGVNSGPSTAAQYFQRWLNGFNSEPHHYQDIFVDGRIGPVTLDTFRAFLKWRGSQGERTLFIGINSSRGDRFLEITENDKSQREFLYGWVSNRVMQW